ncbi:MAG: tyrosine--tRNA ligase [Candidatus Magasanikbacteria bacterium CG10_big_fil_rev_8_21_14_0_10_40_10]|uniref:Tyrosine--tRNA ligase n=1 Tax=Candidatus Magasanikbacteria bacterium CG10_big_fil_rev_8_21_14_0_10_40_10 TaxID=1974648 RepID=A0A2M6W2T5_9BACT|nr:MAG: tyrosine--tRNA ligase [Candidatus Magasanikbacteria bacterium CG10_big_fil_rev_8_21_14_0_10_40_10]
MTKILTDKKLIEEFLTRGVENIYPSADLLRKKLMSGERLKIYQGFDPTGPYLHVGHAMGIRALRILQKLGHEVIFLVGDYTAKVGDPDKDSTRVILSDEIIKNNMAGWKKQAAQLIDFSGDNPVRFERNYNWLSKLKLNDLIKLMSHMTVQQMLVRDLFERRLKEGNPIQLQEFIYPLMQGYDSVVMDVDMEIGGADQTFNMLVGRDLVKSYLNKEKFIRVNKMMDAPDGITMSKTKGNGINLGDTAEEMYGKAMSYPDSAIINGLELLTDISLEVIKNITISLKEGENPMQYKKMMAFEIVKTIKGKEAAQVGQAYFEKTVQNKEVPESVVIKKIKDTEIDIVDLLLIIGLVNSKSEARRLIAQGGIKVAGETIDNAERIFKMSVQGILVQRGKRQFVKVVKQ